MTITKLEINMELRQLVMHQVDDDDTELIRNQLIAGDIIRRRFFWYEYDEEYHTCRFEFTTNYMFTEAIKCMKNTNDIEKVVLV